MKLVLNNNYIEGPNDNSIVWLVWDWFTNVEGQPGFACYSLFDSVGWMEGWLSNET